MNRLLLPLLVTSPILAALAPQSNAAAIAHNPGELSPRHLGRAALARHIAGSVPTGAIKISRLLGSSNEIVPTAAGSSVFGGTLDLGTGGAIKTGAGTLSLTGSDFLTGAGFFQISGGLIMTNVWATSPPSVSDGSAGITLNGGSLSISTGALTVNSGSLLSSGLVTTGTGTLSIQAGSISNLDALWIGDGAVYSLADLNGYLLINDGAILTPHDAPPGVATDAAPAAGPVPEPGSAILFAIGALAASQTRRRRAV